MWPWITFEVIPHFMKSFSIYRQFYQNRFINDCARKKKAKIQKLRSYRVFFVRYRRSYVFKNTLLRLNVLIKTLLSEEKFYKQQFSQNSVIFYLEGRVIWFRNLYLEDKDRPIYQEYLWIHSCLFRKLSRS